MSYKNKFLEKIEYDVKNSTSTMVFTKEKGKRGSKWHSDRKKQGGWDTRVAWNLDSFILENLYTWLKIYEKDSKKCINLEYHKFEINGETLTQKQCIDRMIEDLEFILKNNDKVANQDKIDEVILKTKDCFEVLGTCIYSLWY